MDHQKFKQTHAIPLTCKDSLCYEQLQKTLKITKLALRKVEVAAIGNRLEFLLRKIGSAYDENDQKLLKCFRDIYRSERRRYAFKKLTPLIKGKTPLLLDRITVTNEEN